MIFFILTTIAAFWFGGPIIGILWLIFILLLNWYTEQQIQNTVNSGRGYSHLYEHDDD